MPRLSLKLCVDGATMQEINLPTFNSLGRQEAVVNVPNEYGASEYRDFSKKYYFHPYAKIKKTGKRIEDCIENSSETTGDGRYAIFKNAFKNGRRVHAVNFAAKQISPNAEHDGDIFIGIVKGYIELHLEE